MSNLVKMSEQNELQIDSLKAANFLKTLANSNRLVILSRLLGKEMCVGDLEKNLDISQSALSQHRSFLSGRSAGNGRICQRDYFSASLCRLC